MAWAMLPGLMSLTRIECLRWDGTGGANRWFVARGAGHLTLAAARRARTVRGTASATGDAVSREPRDAGAGFALAAAAAVAARTRVNTVTVGAGDSRLAGKLAPPPATLAGDSAVAAFTELFHHCAPSNQLLRHRGEGIPRRVEHDIVERVVHRLSREVVPAIVLPLVLSAGLSTPLYRAFEQQVPGDLGRTGQIHCHPTAFPKMALHGVKNVLVVRHDGPPLTRLPGLPGSAPNSGRPRTLAADVLRQTRFTRYH